MILVQQCSNSAVHTSPQTIFLYKRGSCEQNGFLQNQNLICSAQQHLIQICGVTSVSLCDEIQWINNQNIDLRAEVQHTTLNFLFQVKLICFQKSDLC